MLNSGSLAIPGSVVEELSFELFNAGRFLGVVNAVLLQQFQQAGQYRQFQAFFGLVEHQR